MEDIKKIDRKIDDIIRMGGTKEQKRALNQLRKAILSYSDKLYYESNYEKRFCLSNYNKFVYDVKDLGRETFYMIFIKIDSLTLNYHVDAKETENARGFIKYISDIKSTFKLAKYSLYKVCDYLVLIAYKKDVNAVYQKIKQIKNSNNFWKGYQMTYIKHQKHFSSVPKNISACIKQANNIFSGEKQEKNEWE